MADFRADLNTIRKIAIAWHERIGREGIDPGWEREELDEQLAIIRAALDRLAGCVILTREEAKTVRLVVDGATTLRGDALALLDARLGETPNV